LTLSELVHFLANDDELFLELVVEFFGARNRVELLSVDVLLEKAQEELFAI
jgi:hypothetical protein